VTEVDQPQTFNIVAEGTGGVSPADRADLAAFQQKVTRLYRAVSGSLRTADELKNRVKMIRRALAETPADTRDLLVTTEQIDARLNRILVALRGDVALAARNENVPPSINERVTSILDGTRFALATTATHRQAYEIASAEFAQQLASLRTLVQVDLARLEKSMEQAGAPWTTGRLPEWKPEE
jgi:hypothetical protein